MGKFGGAEIRTAHGAVFSVGMACLLKILEGTFRVKRQMKLVTPAELETRLGQGIVTDNRTRMSFGEIRSVCGNLVCYYTYADILLVRKCKMLLRCHITKHSCPQPRNLGTADS